MTNPKGQHEDLLAVNEKMKTDMEKLKDDFKEESAKRARAEDAWMKATQRADRAEAKVQVKKAKMNEMDHAFNSAIDRALDRVFYYPPQFEDSSWFVMDRRTAYRIMEEERREAIRHLNINR